MQDSIELPDSSFNSSNHDQPQQFNHEEEDINFCISPNVSAKKHVLVHNGSESSLAYSTSTKMFGINTERSPFGQNFAGPESSSKKQSQSNRLLGKYAANDFPISLQEEESRISKNSVIKEESESRISQSSKIQNRNAEDRRKTINKTNPNNSMMLARQKKELEYALQLQMITSEQLRTKVSILSQLVEQNLKNSEIAYLLKLKNSSSSMKNVDVFVEMKKYARKVKENELIMDQQNLEILKLKEQITNLTQKSYKKKQKPNIIENDSISFNKENFNSSNTNNSVDESQYRKKIEMLEDEKQSVFNYVEELKEQFTSQIKITQQLKEQISRLQEKQSIWVDVQRPKLCMELNEKAKRIQEQTEEIEKLKMQINLIELTQIVSQKNREEVQEDNEKGVKQVIDVETQTVNWKQGSLRSISVQAGSHSQMDVLSSELDLLKTERDYYIEKYKKMLEEIGRVHSLKVQLAATKSQLEQLTALHS